MKYIILMFAILFTCLCASAQSPSVAWEKRYPNYSGSALISDSSGGFVVADYTAAAISITHINAMRDTVWQYVNDTLLYVIDMRQTSDGGYILTAANEWNEVGLIKLNAQGVSEWGTGDVLGDYGYTNAIAQTSDGGFLSVYATMMDDFHTRIIRYSATGDTLWTRLYDIFAVDSICAILPFADGTFMLVGSSGGSSMSPGVFLMKCNAQGDSLWTQLRDEMARAYDAVMTPTNIYIAGSVSEWMGSRFGFMKTDTSGNLNWTREENGGLASSIKFASDSTVILCGNVWVPDAADAYYVTMYDIWGFRIWLMMSEIDANFETFRWGQDAVQTADGGCVILAEEQSWTYQQHTMLLIKLCPSGSNSGGVGLIRDYPDSGAYRIYCENGALDTLFIPHVSPGTTGWVTGNAANSWVTLTNGDGNDGDSLIFMTREPFTSGSLDTFWISRPDNRCTLDWSLGCRSGSLNIWNGSFDSIRFYGARISPSDVQFTLRVYGERNIHYYEIWGTDQDRFSQLTTLMVPNDSSQHTYTFHDLGEHYQWYFTAVTQGDCHREFRQYMLYAAGLSVPESPPATVRTFALSAFPNPFNPNTTISFTLPQTGKAKLAVYDILGREVKLLHEGMMEAGEHTVAFDGSVIASGIYFARLESGNTVKTHKILLMK